ncbi:MAG: CDP-diacylglycerol--serine O-phosphatidyltransferase [Actinobacteria bacterium]|nr:CDP-diacylglycerol--serine O-phosphatidyltransferase [Actinomycetota bacterium]
MRIEVLPNVITGANLVVGMLAVIYAVQGRYVTGAIMILVAAVLDRFDGKLARKMGTNSEFGKELDSLADLISFGVAPALTAYLWKLNDLGLPGILLIILFVLCGALRLARFNVMDVTGHFLGVPITIAGSFVAIIVLAAGQSPPYVSGLMVLVLALLMISSIKIPKL